MVTWFLISIYDFSTDSAAICLSSAVNEKAFSRSSQGHILITPPSDPDHKSPGINNKIQSKYNNN
jgi:hypothetical protein